MAKPTTKVQNTIRLDLDVLTWLVKLNPAGGSVLAMSRGFRHNGYVARSAPIRPAARPE